jgi:vacuolar-type H+-ATPase subunit I/STV1
MREPDLVTGLVVFAGTLMVVVGVFHALVGIAALVDDKIYVTTPNHVYTADIGMWGWLHLLLGILVAVVGVAVLQRRAWGRFVGIGLAALGLVSNLLFIPYHPVWSVLIIALEVAIIWALPPTASDLRSVQRDPQQDHHDAESCADHGHPWLVLVPSRPAGSAVAVVDVLPAAGDQGGELERLEDAVAAAAPWTLRRASLVEASELRTLLERLVDRGTAAPAFALELLERMSGSPPVACSDPGWV